MKLTFAGMAAAALIAATGAIAAPQDTINAIVDDLAGEGFTRVEIVNRPNSIKVEAFGPNGSVERVYDGNGAVLREWLRAADFGLDSGGRDRDRSDDRRTTAGQWDDDGPDHDRDDDHGDDDHDDDHGSSASKDGDRGERQDREDHDREDRDHDSGHDREDHDDD